MQACLAHPDSQAMADGEPRSRDGYPSGFSYDVGRRCEILAALPLLRPASRTNFPARFEPDEVLHLLPSIAQGWGGSCVMVKQWREESKQGLSWFDSLVAERRQAKLDEPPPPMDFSHPWPEPREPVRYRLTDLAVAVDGNTLRVRRVNALTREDTGERYNGSDITILAVATSTATVWRTC